MPPSNKILELETRKKIFQLVNKHAGSHFRDIERKINLAPSSVKYHLDYLNKYELIIEQKEGNKIRYFPKIITNQIKQKNQNNQLLILLRQKSIRNILLFLLNNKNPDFQEIVTFVNLSPSTVSWHLKKLKNKNIISSIKNNNHTNYKLIIQPEELIQLLITYKESFLDSLVNKTIEVWDVR